MHLLLSTKIYTFLGGILLMASAFSETLEYAEVHDDIILYHTQFNDLFEVGYDSKDTFCLKVSDKNAVGVLSFEKASDINLLYAITYHLDDRDIQCQCTIQKETNIFVDLIGQQSSASLALLIDYFGNGEREVFTSEYTSSNGKRVLQFSIRKFVDLEDKAQDYNDFYRKLEEGWGELDLVFHDVLAVELTLEKGHVQKVWVARGFSY